MYAMTGKRFSCLIHFSIYYDFFSRNIRIITNKPFLAGECILSQSQELTIAQKVVTDGKNGFATKPKELQIR